MTEDVTDSLDCELGDGGGDGTGLGAGLGTGLGTGDGTGDVGGGGGGGGGGDSGLGGGVVPNLLLGTNGGGGPGGGLGGGGPNLNLGSDWLIRGAVTRGRGSVPGSCVVCSDLEDLSGWTGTASKSGSLTKSAKVGSRSGSNS